MVYPKWLQTWREVVWQRNLCPVQVCNLSSPSSSNLLRLHDSGGGVKSPVRFFCELDMHIQLQSCFPSRSVVVGWGQFQYISWGQIHTTEWQGAWCSDRCGHAYVYESLLLPHLPCFARATCFFGRAALESLHIHTFGASTPAVSGLSKSVMCSRIRGHGLSKVAANVA